MTMDEHTAFAAVLAAHFGNDTFEAVAPRDVMLYLIAHHDAGWRDLDALALRDPATGLPYNLVQTPFEHTVRTSAASPEFNARHHPYAGLLSSMHSWGLYNGRYGMSDRVLITGFSGDKRVRANSMLAAEEARQDALKAELREDPATAAWIDEDHLFQNYKQLQFFDTLALYFNATEESARAPATFPHVPMTASEDVDVSLVPRGGGVYELNPYPFDDDKLEITFAGRYLEPVSEGDHVRPQFHAAPGAVQRVCLRAAR